MDKAKSSNELDIEVHLNHKSDSLSNYSSNNVSRPKTPFEKVVCETQVTNISENRLTIGSVNSLSTD
jgi:hypothetical protein